MVSRAPPVCACLPSQAPSLPSSAHASCWGKHRGDPRGYPEWAAVHPRHTL